MGYFEDTHARNRAKSRVTVSFWDVIGLLRGHTCKKSGKNLCDGVVLGRDRPVSGTHMHEIGEKLVGVWE